MSQRFVILFVCTGNTCRSPMAEGGLRVLLQKEHPDKFDIISAGTGAAIGFPATMYAIEASKIWDADISEHKSRPLTAELVDRADLIFGMSTSHIKEIRRLGDNAEAKSFLLKSFPNNNPEGEEVEDPIGQPLDRYNETFLEIGESLGKHLQEIIKRIDEKINAT
ncbi:MAG: low molecular weight protein arginine phosphatase [candidate division Zixibacteria bacterium]|nr:low molecular weight protein arginine phosphatase [candidate division Zixibacteria bacterium]